MLAEGVIGEAEVANAVQIDKLDVAGSQSQPLILTIADNKEGLDQGMIEKERQATAMDLVGGQEVAGHQLASQGDLVKLGGEIEGGGVTSDYPFSSSYIDTNLSIPNIVVESFKSNQPEPDYSWEPFYTHKVAKIEVPAQFTQKTAVYVK